MLEAVIEVLPSIQNDQSPDPEQPLLLDCKICYYCGTPLCAMNRYPTRLDYTHVACQIVNSYICVMARRILFSIVRLSTKAERSGPDYLRKYIPVVCSISYEIRHSCQIS